MKNILVPTDFSSCSFPAIELGIAFAELFDANLHLFNSQDEKIEGISNTQEYQKNVNVLFDKWIQEAKSRKVKITATCTEGKFLNDMRTYVDENEIDFVVMGSHGASGKQEYFIGSNTQKVIRSLHVPVFVIKNTLKKYALDNIVYASNFDLKEKESFLRFLGFIKLFSPKKIHLLAINTSGWFGQPFLLMKEAMEDFKKLCTDIKCEAHFYRDLSVDVGVRHFAEEVDADLIVISNHNRHTLKRIFSGSNVEALINHCDQPVLSIDFSNSNNS